MGILEKIKEIEHEVRSADRRACLPLQASTNQGGLGAVGVAWDAVPSVSGSHSATHELAPLPTVSALVHLLLLWPFCSHQPPMRAVSVAHCPRG